MTNIKERALQIAKNQHIAYEKFSENIGMTYGSFKGEAKKTPLNSDAIEKILTIYNNINPEWLILGIGNMIKVNILPSTENKKLEDEKVIINSDTPHTIEAFTKLVDFSKELLDNNKLLAVGQNKLIDQAGELVASNTKLVNLATNAPNLNAQEISLPIHQAMSRMIEAFAVKFGGEKANRLYADIHKKVFDTPANRKAAGKTHTADNLNMG